MKVFQRLRVLYEAFIGTVSSFFVDEYERIGSEFDRELHPLEEQFIREMLPEVLKRK